MMCAWCITLLLLATAVSGDYYVDNANTSVLYSMAPSQSGPGWQSFSVSSQQLALSISNTTGNYTITLDASHCYDENYALGVCGTGENCAVQVPFTGSGITMYVFSAGASGMTASFSVDGSLAVSNTIQAPPPPTYQVSNVSLYDIQGLPSGNHTMVMTVLDWNGSPSSMKFDYAYVNETFVTSPATTSLTSSMASMSTPQAPTQTPMGSSSSSNEANVGVAIGGTLGVVIALAGLGFGIFWLRKRKAPRQDISPECALPTNPFGSEHPSNSTPRPAPYTSPRPFFAQHVPTEARTFVPPLQRSAILRDALVGSNRFSEPVPYSQSIMSGVSSEPVLQPLRRQASRNADADPPANSRAYSHAADAGSPLSDNQIVSRQSLTTEQLDVIDRLRTDKVSAETIARVIGGFVASRTPPSETDSGHVTRGGSIQSALPPPSYQTRAR